MYSNYVREQSELNELKFGLTSLTATEVAAIASHYRGVRSANLAKRDFFGLCHGVRNGAEIRAFAGAFGRRVIGTDISTTILQVPDGFLCDFSESPPLWVGKVDFLYSNAHDHAADLDKALARWQDLLAPGGLMFLQWTPNHAHDMRMSLDQFLGRLRSQGLSIDKQIDLLPSRGTSRLVDEAKNAFRFVAKPAARRVLSPYSRSYWSIGYSLRHGVLVETNVIVASVETKVSHLTTR